MVCLGTDLPFRVTLQEVQFQDIIKEHKHYYNEKCMSCSRHYIIIVGMCSIIVCTSWSVNPGVAGQTILSDASPTYFFGSFDIYYSLWSLILATLFSATGTS